MVAPNDFNACNPNIYPSSAGVGFHSDRRSLVGVGERRDVIRTLSVVCKFPTRGTAIRCDHVHTLLAFLHSFCLSGDLGALLSD